MTDSLTAFGISDESATLALLDRVDAHLQEVAHSNRHEAAGKRKHFDALPALIVDLRQAIVERDATINSITKRSDALARAQAEAIVHSAEIIDELERTKQHLADARASAEKAAHDTKRLADTVFERTNDGVLVFCDQKCVACNDNALFLLNTSRSDILGKWPAAFMTASFESGASASARIRQAYDNVSAQSPTTVETRMPQQSGGLFWAEVTMSAFSMKDAGHVLVIVRDISARKQFEEELRRHRDFLNNIINAVPDQLSVTSTDSTLVLANDAFCSALGVQRDEAVGKQVAALLPDSAAEQYCRVEKQLLTSGEPKTTEHEGRRTDGTTSVVSVKHSAFEDNVGNRYFVASSRDITEDRAREARLRLLASVFNGASEGVAILAPTGKVCEANPAFLAMASDAVGSLVGQPLEEILRFDCADIGRVLQEVANGQSWSGKAYVTDRGRHCWVSLSPSNEGHGESAHIIALVSDITELEFAQQKLRTQALYDSLTGLPNRGCFRDHLQSLIERKQLSQSDSSQNEIGKEKIAICFLDLDDFKHVNDSAGHAAGDDLLKAVGRRIQRVMGGDAFVARFGGDEFAMILPGHDHESTTLMNSLDRLLAEFRNPFSLAETEAVVGLSIGVTSFPQHATEVSTLMCNADIAMYASKSAGKNRVCVFTAEMQDGVNTRHQVQTKLRRALKGGDITLWYQPKVYGKTGLPAGCEALARWQTSEGEFIPPSEFIPVAEQTGLIVALGELVFRRAAEQACALAAAGQLPEIAVNISPHQIRHPGFVKQLQAILAETGANAEWFELEVTEHAMMDDVAHAVTVVDELASLGFKVAIDDFGTGYSSLSYLKDFRIHTLKIDLSFIRDVTSSLQSNAVVRSIVSLGSGLGLNVVAEGVETPEQAKLLSEMGCTALQGYHISRPMTADRYLAWLKSHSAATSN